MNLFNKVYKWLNNPISLLIALAGFLITPFISVFRYFVITHYTIRLNFLRLILGGIYKMYYVFFGLLILIIFFWVKIFLEKGFTKMHERIFKLSSTTALLASIFSYYLISLENKNYPNYLYSTYGVKRSHLELIFIITGYLKITVFQPQFEKEKTFFKKITFLVSVAGLLIFFSQSVQSFIIWEGFLGYAKENYSSRFIHYNYIEELFKTVPVEGKVIHPPQNSIWPAIGNQPVLRYFLHPRILIGGELLSNQDLADKIGTAYFVEIDPTNVQSKWPSIERDNFLISFDGKTKIKYSYLETFSNQNGIYVYRITF